MLASGIAVHYRELPVPLQRNAHNVASSDFMLLTTPVYREVQLSPGQNLT